jgi:hypothetical protein
MLHDLWCVSCSCESNKSFIRWQSIPSCTHPPLSNECGIDMEATVTKVLALYHLPLRPGNSGLRFASLVDASSVHREPRLSWRTNPISPGPRKRPSQQGCYCDVRSMRLYLAVQSVTQLLQLPRIELDVRRLASMLCHFLQVFRALTLSAQLYRFYVVCGCTGSRLWALAFVILSSAALFGISIYFISYTESSYSLISHRHRIFRSNIRSWRESLDEHVRGTRNRLHGSISLYQHHPHTFYHRTIVLSPSTAQPA